MLEYFEVNGETMANGNTVNRGFSSLYDSSEIIFHTFRYVTLTPFTLIHMLMTMNVYCPSVNICSTSCFKPFVLWWRSMTGSLKFIILPSCTSTRGLQGAGIESLTFWWVHEPSLPEQHSGTIPYQHMVYSTVCVVCPICWKLHLGRDPVNF